MTHLKECLAYCEHSKNQLASVPQSCFAKPCIHFKHPMCEHSEGGLQLSEPWRKKKISSKFEESWILIQCQASLSATSLLYQEKQSIIAMKWTQSCTGQLTGWIVTDVFTFTSRCYMAHYFRVRGYCIHVHLLMNLDLSQLTAQTVHFCG